MITLTPITEPAKLDEYYRFRYRIYRESRQVGFLKDKSGIDKDSFDDRAKHYGWYVDDELAGCVRFVEPDDNEKPLPMFDYLTDRSVIDVVGVYIAMRKAHHQRMVEASRYCLAPEHRGLRTAKEFVLAMIRTMQPLGYEHGLFDCDARHGAFYSLLGFDDLNAVGAIRLTGLDYMACIKQYDFAKVLARNPGMMEGTGFKMACAESKAA
jgi:hypothetical protein